MNLFCFFFLTAAVMSHGLWNQFLSGSSENLVERGAGGRGSGGRGAGGGDTESHSTVSSRTDRPSISPSSPRSEQVRDGMLSVETLCCALCTDAFLDIEFVDSPLPYGLRISCPSWKLQLI